MIAYERDGKSAYHGPACRCGSRNTQRVEGKFLVRRCFSCGGTYYFRCHDGNMVPLDKDTAMALDEARR